MSSLGLDAKDSKCQAPDVTLDWIGVTFNFVTITMMINVTKVREAASLCEVFLSRRYINKKPLESLLGKVLHFTKCTTGARKFTNRLLDMLHLSSPTRSSPVTWDTKLDFLWLTTFLQHFNGLTLIKPSTADMVAYIDAYPEGIGGLCPGVGLYTHPLPQPRTPSSAVPSGSYGVSPPLCPDGSGRHPQPLRTASAKPRT